MRIKKRNLSGNEIIKYQIKLLIDEQTSVDYFKGFMESLYIQDIISMTRLKQLLHLGERISEKIAIEEIKEEYANESWDC